MRKTSLIAILWVGMLQAGLFALQESWSERANKHLEEILHPGRFVALIPARPIVFPEPAALTQAWVNPPLYRGQPPRPGLEPIKPVRPRLTQEPPALAQVRVPLESPQVTTLPTTALVALPRVDITRPIPVPILSQPMPDRIPLSDATLEASIAAALVQTIPPRTQPVPFVPQNLPDPFELLQAMKLHSPPEESPTPLVGTPRILPLAQPTK